MRGPRLRLLCFNDVYTLENFPRLLNLLRARAADDPADVTLITLAGDFIAPSLLSGLDAGRGMVDCMNALGVTHVTFGNHEDDVSVEELRKRIDELKAVWLGTNVNGVNLPRYVIVSVSGAGARTVHVGLIGVVMNDPSIYRRVPFGATEVEPANESAMAETSRLLREGRCACVIPMTHQTEADDRALAAAQRDPAFPVIVGGHEHIPFLAEVEGTWIVKAGTNAEHAVIVDLEWPAEKPGHGFDLPTVRVSMDDAAKYPEDAAMRARVDGHMALVKMLSSATLLAIPDGVVLSSIGTRERPSSLATLLASRLRDAFGAELCILNGGGIRGAHDYVTRFTYADLETEVPFDNEIVVVPIPGDVLVESISFSRARVSGAYLHVDDRALVEEPSHRLLEIDDAPIDPTRAYRVALVRNLLAGLDHVEPLVRFAKAHPEVVPPAGSGRAIKIALVDAFARQIWQHLEAFDLMDTNHDGAIDAPELAAAIARATHEPPSEVTAGLVMRALDEDHDARISREEAAKIAARERGAK